ncbi:uncharacterized protein RHO17_009630 [Thomomys bottae]
MVPRMTTQRQDRRGLLPPDQPLSVPARAGLTPFKDALYSGEHGEAASAVRERQLKSIVEEGFLTRNSQRTSASDCRRGPQMLCPWNFIHTTERGVSVDQNLLIPKRKERQQLPCHAPHSEEEVSHVYTFSRRRSCRPGWR